MISRRGYDWADRFSLIVSAALKLRPKHFVIDGEVVVLDKDGMHPPPAENNSPDPDR